MFLDGLLTSYQQIETGFAQQLYQLYKGFEFRSLWVVQEKLAEFERRAVLAAQGTGNLKGVLELTKALQEIDNIENKGQRASQNFATQSPRINGHLTVLKTTWYVEYFFYLCYSKRFVVFLQLLMLLLMLFELFPCFPFCFCFFNSPFGSSFGYWLFSPFGFSQNLVKNKFHFLYSTF